MEVRLVVHAAFRHFHLPQAVALEIVHRAARRVDRDLVEVRTAQPRELRVLIGEEPALQKRIIREIDARHNVRRQKCHLFRLGEEVVHVPVEHHLADHAQRDDFLRDELRRVQHIEIEAVRRASIKDLQGRAPTPGSRRARWLPTDRAGGNPGPRR